MTIGSRTRFAIVTALVGAAAVATALALFPRAFPAVALENQLTAVTAVARADSFLAAHDLAPAATRRVVLFRASDSLLTYVDLAAGGTDSVNALVRGRDAAPFLWTVRAYEPADVHEATVDLAPDGRVLGFRRKLAEADVRPNIGADSAESLARTVIARWLGDTTDRWTRTASSYETRKTSEREDRTFTFERTDRTIGEATLRLDIVIGGDTPIEARPYAYVPESFSRRYGEMRSANNLLSLLSTIGVLGLLALGVWSLRTHSRGNGLRWRAPIMVGTVVGGLFTAAAFNSLGAGWYFYDTATPAALHQAILVATAIASGVITAALLTVTLAAAEAATRSAFPNHLDWWKLWRHRGTTEVAWQVAGGYVVAAIALAYVAAFYVVTRQMFGWWVPSELLDDPNQIATAAPWVSGIALSLQAGIWEEALFRALPLSLLSLWVGSRPHRGWWMAGGVVATALVFGFAHASYPSWPPYSRGVEIFLDACFWGVLFLRFGLLVTVLAHFAYDLVLFSLFTATGSAPQYRIAAAIAGLALMAPAIAVAWRAFRQRGLVPAPTDARFGAWRSADVSAQPRSIPIHTAPGALSVRSTRLAVLASVAALIAVIAVPSRPTRGPEFTTTKARAIAVTDSMVAAQGVRPEDWRRLSTTATDPLASWPEFLREHKAESLAAIMAPTYAVPAWWVVRYVHTEGTLAERAEEWRARVFPDGRPLDIRHIVADSAPGGAPPADSARRIAHAALAAAGIDTMSLRESEYAETQRPNRRDATITWIDTTISLPAGATARAFVTLAGTEVLVVRRSVELPEAFDRANRERRTKAMAYAGLFGVVLFGCIVAGAIVVGKQRPVLVDDRTFDGRTSRIALVVMASWVLASAFNGLPAAQYAYDTAVPWSTHMADTLMVSALTVIGVAMLAGIWMLFEMLRRRAGIVAWPADGERSWRDATVAGAGMAAVLTLGTTVPGAFRVPAIGSTPTTSLDEVAPYADAVLALPVEVAARVAMMAIPLLVILAVTPVVRKRWMLVALLAVLGAAIVAPVTLASGDMDIGWVDGLLSVGLAASIVVALRWWGPQGAVAWLVGALTAEALARVRAIAHAGSTDQLAWNLAGLTAVFAAYVWLKGRAPSNAPSNAPANAPATPPAGMA